MAHLISHSEVEAFGQCEKKHDYAHIQQLQPVTSSIALARGNAGHFTFETFLKAIKDGAETIEAKKAAFRAISDSDDFEHEVITQAISLTMPWIDFVWPKLGWKIVDVEREYRVTIDSDLIYPFKFDALVETKKGLVIVDHKFVADPYAPTTMRLMPQIPRYLGALRALGIDAKSGIYNFVRTRKLNDPMARYIQEPLEPTNFQIQNSVLELIQEMRKIDALEKLPLEERPIAVRTVNKMNCDHCGFAELCALELEGRNSDIMRRTDYMPNTYGYKDIEAPAVQPAINA